MFVDFSLWFLTFTPAERIALAAAFLVFIGVAGEYVIEIPAIDERPALRIRIKQLAMAVLLLGLAGDVLGIVMSQSETAALMQEAADARKSAKEASDASASAKSDAKTAQDEADAVHREADELDGQLATTKGELKSAEADAVELKNSLAPREDLAFIQSDGKSNIDEMKAFSGIKVILKFVPEYLTMQSAAQIERRVTDAGWEVVSRRPDTSIWPGVKIYRHLGPSTADFGNADERRSEGAATALCNFLHSFHWECEIAMGSRAQGPFNVPPNSLMIEVGPKPEPYFAPSWQKPFDPSKPIRQQMEEQKRLSKTTSRGIFRLSDPVDAKTAPLPDEYEV